jgi:hypothetical protein
LANETFDRFRPILEPLEIERLKILHDRKALLFVALLLSFLGFLLLISAFVGESGHVAFFGCVMFVISLLVFAARARPANAFQKRVRAKFAREWFSASFPGCFLGPAPPPAQVPVEVSRSLREACIRATAQSPSRTAIEERIFFDNDSYHSWTFVLRERGIFGGVKSRAIVWFRAAAEETLLVAYVWPPMGLSGSPDVRFFMNGKPIDATEPLRTKLVSVYDRLRAKAGRQAVRVSLSPTGVWAGVKLKESFFEPPPISASLLDPDSFAGWLEQAALPTDREIVSLLFTI